MTALDETLDPSLRSWVEDANVLGTDFPIQNLPFGVFRHDFEERPRVGIAIGAHVLDCLSATRAGLFDSLSPPVRDALQSWSLNALMALGRDDARAVRRVASRLLRADTADGRTAAGMRDALLVRMDGIGMCVPAEIGDYTDFYASVFHATNVGALFRPDNPLLPNYKWVPIGYHGRASTVVSTGTPVRRPRGQRRPDEQQPPVFGPSVAMDYELEVAAWVGGMSAPGETIPIAQANERVFGLSLLNDWSARDIQSWEYQPLGPFLSKSFATTVSPWVVTADALAPFRTPAFARPEGDPAPLPYLHDAADQASGGYDITLEVWLRTAAMRAREAPAVRLSHGNFQSMYWTMAQLLTHHASNGCTMRAGDLLGSGTVSGAEAEARGCLLELTRRGAEPVALPEGETRAFLQDGDEVIIRGWCERDGATRIGFGDCRGVVLAAT
ncbi:MAG: fumarylacetoacetase [Gemmatimonadetes bacterium]|nr:fumarylacetoacetase [Gemmatimonadota bacterium]